MASQSQFPDLVGKMEIEVLVGNKAFVVPSFLFTGPLEDGALRRLAAAPCRGDVLSVQPNRIHLASACCLVLNLELQCGSKVRLLVQEALVKGSQETLEQQIKKYAKLANHILCESRGAYNIHRYRIKSFMIKDCMKQLDFLREKTGNIEDCMRQIELSMEKTGLPIQETPKQISGKMNVGLLMVWCLVGVLLWQV
jgi:hypothetical protein